MEEKLRKNYIIQAHKNPNQLKRLIDRLDDDCSYFYIHIDLKSAIEPFSDLVTKHNVLFINDRVNCIWGDYSQVIPTINLIKHVLDTAKSGPVIFLSGQDYPIKSLVHIDQFLQRYNDYDFIEFDSFVKPVVPVDGHFYDRISKYKISFSDKRGDFTLITPLLKSNFQELQASLKWVLKRKIGFTKLLSEYREPRNCSVINDHFRGPNWWCLTYDTIKKIYDYYISNKLELNAYYKDTFCADEQFFHTILKELAKKDPSIKVKSYLHYVDFERENVPLPVTFEKADFNTLLNQPEEKLFARKFDEDIDAEILSLIDKHIL